MRIGNCTRDGRAYGQTTHDGISRAYAGIARHKLLKKMLTVAQTRSESDLSLTTLEHCTGVWSEL